MKASKRALDDIFGEAIDMTNVSGPSRITAEVASQTIQAIDLSIILRDIGTLVAREICVELERMGLKSADYVGLPDMPEMVAARLGAELSKAPTQFVAELLSQMKLRG